MSSPARPEFVESTWFKAAQPVWSAAVWGASATIMGATAAAMAVARRVASPAWVTGHLAAPGLARCVPLTGARVVAHFDPGYDAERPAIFCQNHVSVMDGHVASSVIPTPFVGLMNASHFKIPAYGWIMKLAWSVGVHSRESGRTAEVIADARQRVDAGVSILAFPEAHRTLDGRVRPFRRGVFFMARDCRLPVVPVAVRGLYEVNRKGTALFTPGVVEVFVGRQMPTDGLSDDEIGELAAHMHKIVADWVHDRRAPEGVEVPPPPSWEDAG